MTNKHTPGPWAADQMVKGHGLPYAPVVATTLIAKVYSTAFGDDEQALANAHLMASAPELLESLEKVMSWIENWSPEFSYDPDWLDDATKAIAAIKKAKGEE